MNKTVTMVKTSGMLFFLFLFPSFFIMAQPDEGFRNYYVGTMDDSIKIQMDLTLYTDYAVGSYYTENSINGDVRLEGAPSSRGSFVLRESDPDGNTAAPGTFSGRVSPFSETFEGIYRSSDGRTAMPFKLTKVAEYLTDNFGDDFIRAQAYYPHFLSTSSSWQNLNLVLDDENSGYIDRFIAERIENRFISRPDYYRGWEYISDYIIRYYSDDFSSIIINTRESSSEDYPDVNFISKNILFTNGHYREVTLSELFRPGVDYLSVLSDYILKDLKDQGASMVLDSSLTRLGMNDLKIVSITPRFLEFTFVPGSVSSFEDGTYVVRVPYDAIAGDLNRDGFLKRFLSER